MPIGKAKGPKAPKEKKPKKEKPPKVKKPKKGKGGPEQAGEPGQEQEKKKKFPILMLIPAVVIIAAAVIIFVFVLPGRNADKEPDATVSVEPEPPVLPSELPVGDEKVPGMVLGADEFAAQAVLAKTITYTYTDLVDAGKAAETYVNQLKTTDPRYYIVDEELVRQREKPDYAASEGMVLMARNLPKPEPEAEATPAPTEEPKEGESAAPDSSAEPSQSPPPEESAPPVDEAPDMVLTVRITWSNAEGQCVVTADEAEGKVTSPPPEQQPGGQSVGIRQAENQIRSMTPAELGLPGTSMADYEVFPQDVLEMVDDTAYIRLNIYDSVAPYSFVGSYLMGVDGEHLYQVDADTGELVELEFTLHLGGPETAAPEPPAPATGAPESGAPESAKP